MIDNLTDQPLGYRILSFMLSVFKLQNDGFAWNSDMYYYGISIFEGRFTEWELLDDKRKHIIPLNIKEPMYVYLRPKKEMSID